MNFSNQNLLITILLLLIINTSAQPYQSVFNNDSTTWNIAHHELFGILMDNLFTKKHPDSLFSELFLFGIFPDTTYMGKVREDTITGRIWHVDIYGNDEKLIMNMDLMVGDTFSIIPDQYNAVDSVYYVDGRKNIRFNLQTQWDEPVRFIEGVGPNISVVYLVDGYDRSYVSCKYNSDSLIYVTDNPIFIGCDPNPIGIRDKKITRKINLYPNPADKFLSVILPHYSPEKYELQVINNTGMTIIQQNIHIRKSEYLLDVSALPVGIYYVILKNNEHYHASKIIINH